MFLPQAKTKHSSSSWKLHYEGEHALKSCLLQCILHIETSSDRHSRGGYYLIARKRGAGENKSLRLKSDLMASKRQVNEMAFKVWSKGETEQCLQFGGRLQSLCLG